MYFPEGMKARVSPGLVNLSRKSSIGFFHLKNQSLLLIGRWLLISERINFKLSILVHNVSSSRVPTFSTELITSVADILGRATLRSIIKQNLFVQQKKVWSLQNELFLLLDRSNI